MFAGHDGARDVRTSSAVVRSRWVTTPQRLSRDTQQRTPRTINRAEANGDSWGLGGTAPMRVGLLAFPPAARWPELDGAVPGWSAAGAGHVRGRDEQDQPAAQPTAECFAGQAAHPRTATSSAACRCSSVRPAEPGGAVIMTGWSLAALDRLPSVCCRRHTWSNGTVRGMSLRALTSFGQRCNDRLIGGDRGTREGRRGSGRSGSAGAGLG